VQIHKHKRRRTVEEAPEEFIQDCKVLAPDFEKTRPKVQRIYKKWIEKGKKPRTIGNWLRQQLKQWYTAVAATEMLPVEARRPYTKSRSSSKKQEEKHASQFKKTLNSNTSSTQESPKETEKIGSVRNEPTKTHESQLSGKFNQGPDEYEIEEIDEYDIEYLRIIVKWLHQLRMDFIKQAFKWQAAFDEMKKEKAELDAKIKVLEAKHSGK
jgi:hypothetical protein